MAGNVPVIRRSFNTQIAGKSPMLSMISSYLYDYKRWAGRFVQRAFFNSINCLIAGVNPWIITNLITLPRKKAWAAWYACKEYPLVSLIAAWNKMAVAAQMEVIDAANDMAHSRRNVC